MGKAVGGIGNMDENLMDFVFDFIRPHYSQWWRKYHTISHIEKMIEYVSNRLGEVSTELMIAIAFHDIVYKPGDVDNEKESCKVFNEFYQTHLLKSSISLSRVQELILSTRDHILSPNDMELNSMIKADMSILGESLNELLEYESGIFYEYQKYSIEVYRENRVKFLDNMVEQGWGNAERIGFLREWVKQKKYRIGIYAGSFNPYHKGHEDIVIQAERCFDKVVLAQGINVNKSKPKNLSCSFREVMNYNGMITDLFAKECGQEKFLIRGLRNESDVNYEMNLRRTVWDIADIPVVYFFCKKEFEHISSGMIRSLYPYGEEYYKRYLV